MRSTSPLRAEYKSGKGPPAPGRPRQKPISAGHRRNCSPPARLYNGRTVDMVSAEIVGFALLLVLVLSIITIAVRRSLLARSGGVDLCWRTSLDLDGRGWTFGQGRYREGAFVLYRSFSPLPIASRVLRRDRLSLGGR